MNDDTIAAIATPPGRGGIGIVRISGNKTQQVAKAVLGKVPVARQAQYHNFKDSSNVVLDEGIALFFPKPNSFTGEDVLELQGHGGPVILDALLQSILQQGVRIARPGEFSERAFLNDKIDLVQAEAIADLIDAASMQAARAAMHALQGDFSKKINQLVENLIKLRLYVEAAIDFPEEEIDFLSDGKITEALLGLIEELQKVAQQATQGALLREGIHLVIAGKPNVGKSSLLNRLTGREIAIVTDIPGTTRDVLRETIQLDGIPLHLVDTAGIRESLDTVELEGIKRAKAELSKADQILWVVDEATDFSAVRKLLPEKVGVTLVRNKIDKYGEKPKQIQHAYYSEITVSAKTGEGLNALKAHIKSLAGLSAVGEGEFIARRRHIDALERAYTALLQGKEALVHKRAGELLAQDLLIAQQALGEITGHVTPDDLLGRIFSSFCIGK